MSCDVSHAWEVALWYFAIYAENLEYGNYVDLSLTSIDLPPVFNGYSLYELNN